jgi:ATP/maltotriose-dependent transcriptional regulator MalT
MVIRDDRVGLARASNLVGHANWYLCRAGAMEQAFERGLAEMQSAGDYRERWWIITQLLCAAVFGPARPDEGIQRCRDLLALGDGVQSLEMTAGAAIGSLEAMRGNVAEARELLAGSRMIAEELGLRQWLGALANFAGPMELLAGDLEGAEQELRRGYAELEALGETSVLSTTAAFLARTLVLAGRPVEAEEFAAISARLGVRDDVYPQVVWRGALARVQAGRGKLDLAEQLAREAVARATETDFLNLRGESLLDLAEVLRVAGRSAESASATTEAFGLFEAKGCTVLAARAGALLDPAPERTIRS